MNQTNSNTYTHINNLLSHHQNQINHFNESLKQEQIPTELNSCQIEQLFSLIESNASKLNESEVKQLKTKVITLKIDFSHKLQSSAQTLFELANMGTVDADACLKGRRLVAMAEYSLLSVKITPKFKGELQDLIAQLNKFIQKYEVKPNPASPTNQPTLKPVSAAPQQKNLPPAQTTFKPEAPSNYRLPEPISHADTAKKLILQATASPSNELPFEDDFQIRIDSLTSTLNRWKDLLSRNALAGRINLKTFDTLFELADTKNRYDQVTTLKRQFQDLLLKGMQSVIDQYNPNHLAQAQQLLKVAEESLFAKTLSTDFRNDLNKSIEGIKAKMANPQSTTRLTANERQELFEEFQIYLESLGSNLNVDRWKNLLSRKILNLRIDVKVINDLTQKAKQLNDGSPTGQTQSAKSLKQIEDVKNQFLQVLFNLLKNPDPDQLQQLLTMGSLCAKSNCFSPAISTRLNDVLATFNPFTLLPEEVLLNLVRFLGVKNLLITAQVSQDFAKASNHDKIWKEKCENHTERDVIDFSLVPTPHKNYKELYKAETEFQEFMKNSQLYLQTYNRTLNKKISLTAPLDFANEKLKIKHLKQIMKKVAANDDNYKGLIDKNTPYSHIRIMFAGKEMTNDIAIKPLGLAAESNPQFIVRDPTGKPSTETKVETPAPVKVDVGHIAKTMSEAAFNPQVTEANIKSFIDRGGRIEILEEGKPVKLNKTDRFIVGCTSGVNRSQVARAVLLKNGCQVLAPLAGGVSRMNPAADYSIFDPVYMYDEIAAFKQACGCDKVPQLGATELEATDDLNTHEQWFKHYFNTLPAQPHQFLCFASSGPSVILRLLDKPGDLSSYKVTFIPWNDEIAHAPEGIEPFSAEAYKAFFDKLSRNLIIS